MNGVTQLEESAGPAAEDFEIDGRSFHVFERGGQRLLFDRATATVSVLDEAAWQLLRAIEGGESAPEAIRRHCHEIGLSDEAPLVEALQELQENGFFAYEPVDQAEQERCIQVLWEHRPRRIQLLIAQSCNLGCRYCYAWRNGSNQLNKLMSFEIARASVDYLIERSGPRRNLQVTFFGGEPLLNWHVLTQVVDYCLEKGRTEDKEFEFEVITNASLLTKERVHFLAQHRFGLMVSVDGWREMHEYNRPVRGAESNYDEILANAVYANEHYLAQGLWPIKVRANLTDKFHDAPKVENYLRECGFENVAVAPIEPLSHSDPSPSGMTEDDMDEHAQQCVQEDLRKLEQLREGGELDAVSMKLLSEGITDLEPNVLKGIICGVGRNTQCIDTAGNIYPCHRYEGMKAFILGTVFTGLDEERTLRYYRSINGNATNRCHSCWIRDYCSGGCPWLLSTSSGLIVDPSERECNRRRASFEHLLYFRAELRKIRPEFFAESAVQLDEWEFGKKPTPSGCGSGCTSCGS